MCYKYLLCFRPSFFILWTHNQMCPEWDIWTAIGQQAHVHSLYNRFIPGYIVTLFWNHYFSYHNSSAVYDSSPFISSNTYSLNTCLKHPLWVLHVLLSSPSLLLTFFFTPFYHFESPPLNSPIFLVRERLYVPKGPRLTRSLLPIV